jgi:O-antigen ligase/polysaccharide polymerase Wzy-like membrane protein
MTLLLRLPDRALLAAFGLLALPFGVLVGTHPGLAVGVVGVGAVLAAAFMAPTLHLLVLVAITVLVPYGVQNDFSFAAQQGQPGLIATDILLAAGMLRALVSVLWMPLDRRRALAAVMMLAFLVLTAVQAIHGIRVGQSKSVTGYEARVLLGWGTFLLAMPLLAEPASRRRLIKGLLAIGLAVGIWGLVQYFTNIGLTAGSDAGVRSGATVTNLGPAYTESRSIQGGLFAFPIAFLMGVAVLVLAPIRSRPLRLVVLAMVLVNAACLVLTYERTFWLATVVGLGLVVLKGDSAQRVKSVALVAMLVVVSLAALATLSPGSIEAARVRLLSLGQGTSDQSIRARLAETQPMLHKIDERPVEGWGLGDDIVWGMPWVDVSPKPTPFAHNGFLWLAWKLGVVGALLLILLMAWSVIARGPPNLSARERAVRHGAQAGMLVMLIVTITFPSVRELSISSALGVLIAVCLAFPRHAGTRARPA